MYAKNSLLWFGMLILAFSLLAGCSIQESPPVEPTLTQTFSAPSPVTDTPVPTPTIVPTQPPTVTPTSLPTATPTLAPLPEESIFWHFPRRDQGNTAAYPFGAWQLLAEPKVLWSIEDADYTPIDLFPTAGDLDGDGHAEYVLTRHNLKTGENLLTVYNVEDGSVLWEIQPEWKILWGAPVLVDLDNDGGLDLVYAESHGDGIKETVEKMAALRGADGALLWEIRFPGGGQGMSVADVNRDGWVEIITTRGTAPRELTLLNGQTGEQIWTQEVSGSHYGKPAMVDLDGDGDLEILTWHHVFIGGEKLVDRLTAWDHQGQLLWEFESGPTIEQKNNAPPELQYVSCEGMGAPVAADFNADGSLEIAWGTRCQVYLLDTAGSLIWSVPTNLEGWGYVQTKNEDGSEAVSSIHGVGGLNSFSAVGNIDSDPALEIVFPVWPEFDAVIYNPSGNLVTERIVPTNQLWALDGADGSRQWVFEGEYINSWDPEKMFEPILVDLTGDGILDVLTISMDRHLYALHGESGEPLLAFQFYPSPNWQANHLTFVPDEGRGLLIFIWHRRGQFHTLTGMHLTDLVGDLSPGP